jgi:hypothetical protein
MVALLGPVGAAMVKLNIEHHFPDVTPKQFFDMLMDTRFDEALTPALGVKARQVLERSEDERCIRRKVRIVPGFPLPGPVKKLFGDKELEYLEDTVLHKDRFMIDWSSTPNLFSDRVVAKGQVVVRQEGSGVRRTILGEITVNILGVGGLMERVVRESVERSYDKASQFTLEWIRTGKLKDPAAV